MTEKLDLTKDPKFEKVVGHFLKTPPKPRKKEQPDGKKGKKSGKSK